MGTSVFGANALPAQADATAPESRRACDNIEVAAGFAGTRCRRLGVGERVRLVEWRPAEREAIEASIRSAGGSARMVKAWS